MLEAYVKQWEKDIEQRCEKIGEKRGEKRGLAAMLTRQLHRRFGDIPNWVNEKIALAELPSLEEWTLRFVDAKTLDEIFSDEA